MSDIVDVPVSAVRPAPDLERDEHGLIEGLVLLDTDIEENGAHYRDVTDRLYGGNSEHRLRQELLLGVDGAISTLAAGAVVIDTSTIAPSATRRMGEQLATKGILMVDAPVSGGSEGAVNGTLTVFLGGSAEAVAAAQRSRAMACSWAWSPVTPSCRVQILLSRVGRGGLGLR